MRSSFLNECIRNKDSLFLLVNIIGHWWSLRSLNIASKWVSFISCFLVPCHPSYRWFFCTMRKSLATCNIMILAGLKHIRRGNKTDPNRTKATLYTIEFSVCTAIAIEYADRISIVNRFCQKQNKSSFFQWKSTRNWIIRNRILGQWAGLYQRE